MGDTLGGEAADAAWRSATVRNPLQWRSAAGCLGCHCGSESQSAPCCTVLCPHAARSTPLCLASVVVGLLSFAVSFVVGGVVGAAAVAGAGAEAAGQTGDEVLWRCCCLIDRSIDQPTPARHSPKQHYGTMHAKHCNRRAIRDNRRPARIGAAPTAALLSGSDTGQSDRSLARRASLHSIQFELFLHTPSNAARRR